MKSLLLILLSNRKWVIGIIIPIFGVVILLAGITLAWLTNKNSDPGTAFSAGYMDLVVDIAMESEILWRPLHPSDVGEGLGVFYIPDSNLSAGEEMNFLNPFIATFNVNDAKIQKRNGQVLTGADAAQAVKFIVDEDGRDGVAWPLGEWIDFSDPDYEKWSMYNWMKGKDGNYYVELYGDDELHFAYEIITNGYVMDNSYRGADFTLESSFSLVQNKNITAALKKVLAGAKKYSNTGKKASDRFIDLASWVTAGNSYLSYFEFFCVNGDHAYPVCVDMRCPESDTVNTAAQSGFNPASFGDDKNFADNLRKFYKALPNGSRGKAFLAEYYGL